MTDTDGTWQRAFRQRKEGHIKKLEEQVRDYNQLSENYKALQAENYQVRRSTIQQLTIPFPIHVSYTLC